MGLFRWKKTAKDRRRRHERVSVLLRINYEVGNDTPRYNCGSMDISEGGVCFGLYQKLAIGTSLKIQVYLHDSTESVLLIGSVTWIKETTGKKYPYEVGIKFDECSAPSVSRIKDHIQSVLIEKKE